MVRPRAAPTGSDARTHDLIAREWMLTVDGAQSRDAGHGDIIAGLQRRRGFAAVDDGTGQRRCGSTCFLVTDCRAPVRSEKISSSERAVALGSVQVSCPPWRRRCSGRRGSDTVNSYLVVDGDGVTIIDAGLSHYWKLLNSELTRFGMTLDDVRALILTHGGSDHIGFTARLHREKGIPAYVHPADADRARLEVRKPNRGWGPVKARPLAGFLWYSARQGGLRIPRPAN